MDIDIQKIQNEFDQALDHISSLTDLETLSTEYLGRKGRINNLFADLRSSDVDMRELGQAINGLKEHVTHRIETAREELHGKEDSQTWVDSTLPGSATPVGHLHLVTQTIREIRRIFAHLGFNQMSYPEVEWEYYAFDALNMPKIHPARDDFETFFIDAPEHEQYGKMLLTPHATNSQVREMQRVMKEGKPPIKMINISKTYRPNWDTTHVPMFHQFDGLCIDRGINISHLKGTIEYFAKEFFGRDCKIRLRPYDFLFTEPSFEVDIYTGSDSVGRAGWLELGGAGMVHPNVLKEGGIDPQEYTGWAFGFGVERVAMMRGGVVMNDLRVTYSGDVRFLEQF